MSQDESDHSSRKMNEMTCVSALAELVQEILEPKLPKIMVKMSGDCKLRAQWVAAAYEALAKHHDDFVCVWSVGSIVEMGIAVDFLFHEDYKVPRQKILREEWPTVGGFLSVLTHDTLQWQAHEAVEGRVSTHPRTYIFIDEVIPVSPVDQLIVPLMLQFEAHTNGSSVMAVFDHESESEVEVAVDDEMDIAGLAKETAAVLAAGKIVVSFLGLELNNQIVVAAAEHQLPQVERLAIDRWSPDQHTHAAFLRDSTSFVEIDPLSFIFRLPVRNVGLVLSKHSARCAAYLKDNGMPVEIDWELPSTAARPHHDYDARVLLSSDCADGITLPIPRCRAGAELQLALSVVSMWPGVSIDQMPKFWADFKEEVQVMETFRKAELMGLITSNEHGPGFVLQPLGSRALRWMRDMPLFRANPNAACFLAAADNEKDISDVLKRLMVRIAVIAAHGGRFAQRKTESADDLTTIYQSCRGHLKDQTPHGNLWTWLGIFEAVRHQGTDFCGSIQPDLLVFSSSIAQKMWADIKIVEMKLGIESSAPVIDDQIDSYELIELQAYAMYAWFDKLIIIPTVDGAYSPIGLRRVTIDESGFLNSPARNAEAASKFPNGSWLGFAQRFSSAGHDVLRAHDVTLLPIGMLKKICEKFDIKEEHLTRFLARLPQPS